MSSQELCRFIGQTVTIFTSSGGASGCGFTGVLIRVNPCFVTLVDRIGTAPTNPLGDSNICDRREMHHGDYNNHFKVGSVCDIPVNKIVSFCHNAV